MATHGLKRKFESDPSQPAGEFKTANSEFKMADSDFKMASRDDLNGPARLFCVGCRRCNNGGLCRRRYKQKTLARKQKTLARRYSDDTLYIHQLMNIYGIDDDFREYDDMSLYDGKMAAPMEEDDKQMDVTVDKDIAAGSDTKVGHDDDDIEKLIEFLSEYSIHDDARHTAPSRDDILKHLTS